MNSRQEEYMNNRSDSIGHLRNSRSIVGFIALFLLMTCPVLAQSSLKASRKATGEIVSASQTTINGFSAVSGVTVFSKNRIKTGDRGGAIINLGRLGRIECGAETDMTLSLSESSIGGELRSNRLTVSAPAGVAITINTAKGMVRTDGRQPAVLTIYVDGDRARVITHMGAASVVSTEKDRIVGKNERSQSPRSDGWRRREQGKAPTFNGLFKAGIDYSRDPKFDRGFDSKFDRNSDPRFDRDFDSKFDKHRDKYRDRDSDEPFESSMSCRDSFNGHKKHCRKKSMHKPKKHW